jgi:L1 cell adhesion molecule
LNGTESDTQIQGCTIVEGNVVVNNKANTLTDRSLSALATITEITGFLEITNLGSLTTLPLHGLRLIRGQQTRQNPTLGDSNYSLLIGDASEFVQLPFTQLREISNGDVLLANMKKLCNSDTIDWEDIQNGRQDGLVALLVKSASCQPCNESCGDYCWAPDICQIRSFKACSSACDGRCAHPGVFGCCDSQCAGGCYAARNNSQCVACKSYQSGNECVDQCHPLEIYNHTSFQYVPNPNAQYIHGFQCVSQCPGSMFYDGQICVDSCPVGKYADKNSVCVDCNGICPKDCVGGMLNIGTVGNFTNCTRILTHLKINGTGLTLEDLQTLISVRHIRDYLDITHLPASVTSLSFLGNLEEIAGNNTRNLNSLAVESNEQLKELGLRSLQRIVAGDIYVAFNNQLCVNLTRQNLVAAGVINSDQKVTIFNLMDCSSHPPCHSQCNASLGCWAAEDSQQCLGCQNFDYDGTCVGDCGGGTDRLIFSDLKRKECLPCHEECAVGHGCSGVNPDDCMQCKNVRDGPFCRSRCPPGKYLDSKNNHCQSCHSACNGNCTGSGSHKGQGGCDDCDLFILNDNETSVIECADPTTGCPIHKYEHLIVEPDSHLFILHRVCRECDPQCIACAGPGPTNCCANAIDNGQCVSTCPPNKYQSLNSTCEICPAKCGELGCQLMTNTSPVECNECPYLVNSSGINICVSMCPSDRPIVNASNQVCLNQCDQVIVDINGTKFCSECPDNSFVESDGNNTYCSNCHTECHHVAGKKTCLNGSNHVESCLNGCQNFLQGNYCVQACDSNSVPIGQTGSSSSQLGECVKQLMTTTVSTVTRATIDLMETIMPTATTSQVGDNAQNLDDGSDVTVIIIAAAAGGAVLVLLLLAIICCAYHQRHQKKLNLNTVISNDIAMVNKFACLSVCLSVSVSLSFFLLDCLFFVGNS